MWRSSIQRALIFLVLAISVVARAETPPLNSLHQAPQRVLFVCEHGSVKSLIAAEYFNQHAKARGLPFVAIARGTSPAPIPKAVRAGLQPAGFDVAGFEPNRSPLRKYLAYRGWFPDQDIGAQVGGRAVYAQWDHLPAVSEDFGRGRDAIVRRVDALIEELRKTSRSLP